MAGLHDGIVVNDRLTIPESDLSEAFVRAGGPGGQHVNKVSTAVQLRFAAAASSSLAPDQRRRLMRLAGRRGTKDGDVIIEASAHRSLERNRQDARRRLAQLLREAVRPPPPPRKRTRPTRGSIERRLDTKKQRGQVKTLRGRPQD